MADVPAGSERVTVARPLLLWLLLLVQIALPSSYYLWRVDREDERFAWRMFSELRFRSCSVVVSEQLPGGARPVALSEALHASWIGALRRGRQRVIERFLATRCVRAEVEAATLVRSCREVDGRPGPRQRFEYGCSARQLTRESHGGEP